ncbi:MAG TPA: 2OG-Fe(II) oxygenase [Candidatus Binataceae bacterium]|nr:2OG-Fe(II) oxygenase [Candidatus Binataceae bacterium]
MAARAVQILRSGIERDEAQIARLRERFRARHVVRLNKLLDPALLEFVMGRLNQGRWKTRIHPGVAKELVLYDFNALSVLEFVMNQPDFRSTIEEITGIGPLRRFGGRIYRMVPGTAHHDLWHTDVPHFRRHVCLTMNLSSEEFRGGAFMLRDRESKRVLADIMNTGLGDALIFRIDPALEHRVADIEGKKPKTAYAGWFVSDEGEYFDELNRDAERYRRKVGRKNRLKPHKPRTSRIE